MQFRQSVFAPLIPLAASVVATSAFAAPVTYSIQELGPGNEPVYNNSAGFIAGDSNLSTGTSWLHDGTSTTTIGLTGTEHTSNLGHRSSTTRGMNSSGQVIGESKRYNGGSTELGQSAWFYNGTSTVTLGLTGSAYVRDTDGYSYSTSFYPSWMNDAGTVAGETRRYAAGGAYLGEDQWVYNGTSTTQIGLTGTDFTRTDGYRTGQITKVNEASQVLGYSVRYGGDTLLGNNTWVYNGTTTVRIGLYDAEHTRDTDGLQNNFAFAGQHNPELADNLTAAGQVAGLSTRYAAGGANIGNSAWFYDGTTTRNIGLTDAEHTRYSIDFPNAPTSDNYRASSVTGINQSGVVIGNSNRYSDMSHTGQTGQSAWLFNGTTTTNIGMTGAEYTRSNGDRESAAVALNQSGLVAGTSTRYGPPGIGQTAWLYDGTGHTDIGLQDAEHSTSNGVSVNSVTLLNEGGQVLGSAERLGVQLVNPPPQDLFPGSSTWLYDGATTQKIGLTGGVHTRQDGFEYSFAQFLSESGKAAGATQRHGAATYEYDPYTGQDVLSGYENLGWDAWVYDGSESVFLGGLSERADGYSQSEVTFLAENGSVLGTYLNFDTSAAGVTNVFLYTAELGLYDLGTLMNEFDTDWHTVYSSIAITDEGDVIGYGNVGGFIMSPTAIPVPAAFWLFGSALALLGWRRRQAIT